MEATEIKEGMKVHYKTFYGKRKNGIIKSITEDKIAAFVVYHCNNEWENYQNYTGQHTNIEYLTAGWAE